MTAAGASTLNGNVTLGSSSSKDLTINAALASTLAIKTTNTYDIGSTTKGLQYAYFGSSAGSNTTRVGGSAVTADVNLTLPNITGTLALHYGVRTETDTYAALVTDGVILMNAASSKTVTLPPAATAGAGKILVLKKIDSSLAVVITIDGNGSETIDSATTTTLNTQYEAITIYCDGSNWHILERRIPSVWVDGGTVTIEGTTSNPTKASSATKDKFWWRRSGDSAECLIEYRSPDNTGAANGSGDYKYKMPTGLSIDTAKCTAYATVEGFASSLGDAGCVGNVYVGNVAGAQGSGTVVVFDADYVRFFVHDTSPNGGATGSAGYQLAIVGGTHHHAKFTVPVSGWKG